MKTELSSDRENNIRDYFKEQHVDFKYPNNADFNDLLEIYQWKKTDNNENYLGENMILDRVIAMDDISGLPDRSEEFANFLFLENADWLAYTFFIRFTQQL